MDFGSNFLTVEIILMETKMRQKELERRALQLPQTTKKNSKKSLGLISLFTGTGSLRK